jgi:hypothetical protein
MCDTPAPSQGSQKIPSLQVVQQKGILPLVGAPLGGTLQVALTSVRLIGMIRGLFCLLFT